VSDVTGYIAAWMLGPRLGRYDNGTDPLPLGNPTSCIVGLYILWWGWLAFNSGSTFGISGVKWKFAARAATSTIIASIGGGLVGSAWTLIKPGRIFSVMDIVNPVLGALVAVTAGCALYHTADAFLVGIIGGATVLLTNGFTDWTRVDDPVGATPVHG
jgi:Amt family ammonium transporter